MDKQKYAEIVKKNSPKSPDLKNCVWAFLIGGFICAAGEGLCELYGFLGFGKKDAGTLCSVTLIFIGVFLTAIHGYEKIAKRAGAGTLVPITGFSNAMSSPAIEFKSEGFIPGVGAKLFNVAGPIIVYGTAASVLYGGAVYLWGLFY